jgi:hypothetical protein
MRQSVFYRLSLNLISLIVLTVMTGCAGNVPATVSPSTAVPSAITSAPPSPDSIVATPTAPVTDTNVLSQDDFTNPTTE